LSLKIVELRDLGPDGSESLAVFFRSVHEAGEDARFHPHPFTAEEAARRIAYRGQDLYYVIMEDRDVLGYGMLRGWDEGYTIPSLGIAVAPSSRGQGLGDLLMQFLHAAARRRGAARVRLKVYPDNLAAIRLYEKMGYRFEAHEDGQLVGFVDL
jgi:ribosomal-protein-alanine N-acetyltransferase